MSLPLVIEQIFNAQPGCAFPEEMGKQTKIHKPVTLKEIKKEMEEEGEEASVEEGSVGSVGSVEPAKKQRKEDNRQQKINTMFPKLAAHAGTTLLGSIIAVTLMFLKGVGASKK